MTFQDLNSSSSQTVPSGKAEVSPPSSSVLEVSQEEIARNYPHTKRVGNYLLGKTIGEGSFAKVKEGVHVLSGEKVAVKVIDKRKAMEDAYVRRNMRREGRLLQLIRHCNVIQLFDTLETENSYYLVTEFCGGGDLMTRICTRKRLDEVETRRYVRQIVSAVDYLHQAGIMHRDLKVENLLLDERKNIKIIDFGLSNSFRSSDSKDGGGSSSMANELCVTQCGSPAYAAPELLSNTKYGPEIDIWSIGVNMFAMLSGNLPFTVEPFTIKALHSKMVDGDMNPMPEHLTKSCRDLIKRFLTADPSKRIKLTDVMQHPWTTEGLNAPFEDAPFPNKLTALDLNQVIVRHMATQLHFTLGDVIRNVTANVPSGATATYHLLHHRTNRCRGQEGAAKGGRSLLLRSDTTTSTTTTTQGRRERMAPKDALVRQREFHPQSEDPVSTDDDISSKVISPKTTEIRVTSPRTNVARVISPRTGEVKVTSPRTSEFKVISPRTNKVIDNDSKRVVLPSVVRSSSRKIFRTGALSLDSSRNSKPEEEIDCTSSEQLPVKDVLLESVDVVVGRIDNDIDNKVNDNAHHRTIISGDCRRNHMRHLANGAVTTSRETGSMAAMGENKENKTLKGAGGSSPPQIPKTAPRKQEADDVKLSRLSLTANALQTAQLNSSSIHEEILDLTKDQPRSRPPAPLTDSSSIRRGFPTLPGGPSLKTTPHHTTSTWSKHSTTPGLDPPVVKHPSRRLQGARSTQGHKGDVTASLLRVPVVRQEVTSGPEAVNRYLIDAGYSSRDGLNIHRPHMWRVNFVKPATALHQSGYATVRSRRTLSGRTKSVEEDQHSDRKTSWK